jgi:hypothetical protein
MYGLKRIMASYLRFLVGKNKSSCFHAFLFLGSEKHEELRKRKKARKYLVDPISDEVGVTTPRLFS